MSRGHAMAIDAMTMSVVLAAPTASKPKSSCFSPNVFRHSASAPHIPTLNSRDLRLRLSTLCTKAA